MTTVISFHVLHDANVSILRDGEVLAVLELERLFEVRYYVSPPKRQLFTEHWKRAIGLICEFTGISEFDVGVTSWVMPTQREILQTLVQAQRWVTVDHHLSHAAVGFYDSPFHRAFILSYDGGGNDGTFNIYTADMEAGIEHQERVAVNLGAAYKQLACTMSEVTRKPRDQENIGNYIGNAHLALSGKMMGYTALGRMRREWIPAFRRYYTEYLNPHCSLYTLGEEIGQCMEVSGLDEETARDVATTAQHVFTEIACESITTRWRLLQDNQVDGIVLTGGCALNVHTNIVIAQRFGYPVHIPAAPNDCGISVGAAWTVTPPKSAQRLHYAGLPCWDINLLPSMVEQRKAQQVNLTQVVDLLMNGAIIGVVRGRQEWGPRALGHRSMLCYPNKPELRDKLNKLKSREWFRPLCPSIAIESVPKLFVGLNQSPGVDRRSAKYNTKISDVCQHLCIPCTSTTSGQSSMVEGNSSGVQASPGGWIPDSPYMSFAPYLTEDARQMFPAIAHYDGTARLQTVRSMDDTWYHSLLTEVATRNGGYGVLLNTSFNVKGRPILNQVSTALSILDDAEEDALFDYVLVEDWLFTPRKQT